MAAHYQPINRGDSLLVDLGGYGLTVSLSPGMDYYQVSYVRIEYDEGCAIAEVMPAYTTVFDDEGQHHNVPEMIVTEIHRHGMRA